MFCLDQSLWSSISWHGSWLHCVTLVNATHAWSRESDTPIETSAAWQGSSRPAAPSPCSSSLTWDNNILPASLQFWYSIECLLFKLLCNKNEKRGEKHPLLFLAIASSLRFLWLETYFFLNCPPPEPIWLSLVCRLPCDVELGPCIMVCGMSQRTCCCIPLLNRLWRQLCQWVDLVLASLGYE